MKNVAVINSCVVRSTGKIAVGLHSYLCMKGYNSFLCYGRGDIASNQDFYQIDNKIEILLHALYSRITGHQGGGSFYATKRLITYLRKRKVDTVYIISLHTYYINEKLLYNYIVDDSIKVVYVMIDEYAYLGRCPYNGGCNNYKEYCKPCPNKRDFGFWGAADIIYKNKALFYSKMKGNIFFVGPEYVVKKARTSPSMLGQKLMIVDESVDLSLYYPRNTDDLRKQLGIDNSKIILTCIAPLSQEAKGVRFFIQLAKELEFDDRFVFLHVGYDIESKDCLPKNYIPIGYIKDQDLLAQYYSIGDMFVFPSMFDTMSNACIEAMACGTPLLAFNISGMPYLTDDPDIGTYVEAGSVEALKEKVLQIKKKTRAVIDRCRLYSIKRYDSKNYFSKLEKIGLDFVK